MVLLGNLLDVVCQGSYDNSLPAELDTTGGRLELVVVSGTRESILQSLAYGPGTSLPVPMRGTSITRVSDGSYVVSSTPTPRNRNWIALLLPMCGSLALQPLRIERFALGCASGHPVGQFVELRASESFVIPANLNLEVVNPSVGTSLVPISPERVGQVWPAGRSLLFTSSLWATHLGRCSDGTLPTLSTTAGSLRIISGTSGACNTVMDRISYGPSETIGVPRSGVGFHRNPLGALEHEPWPIPTCASGDTTWLVPCLGSDPEQTVVIQEFALLDAQRGLGFQFIELSSSKHGQLADRRVGVRLYGSNGQWLQTIPGDALYPYGGQWRPGVPHLLTGTSSSLSGNYVEKICVPLDTLGGRIELTYQPSGGGPVVVLRTLRYGPGGDIPAPGPGYSAQRMPDGSYVTNARPTPANLAGQLDMTTYPIAGCEIASLLSSTGENEPVGTPRFDRLQTIAPTRSTFDKARGTVSSSAGPGMTAQTIATDRFMLEAPSGTTLTSTARMIGNHITLCDSNDCPSGVTTFGLIVNGVETGRQLSWAQSTVIDVPLTLVANVPFTIGQSVTAKQNGGTGFTRRVFADSRLEFLGVPANMKITSCSGYLQDQPVPTLLALMEAVATSTHARLVWRVDRNASFEARVQRRELETEWVDLGTVAVNGSGELRFEDHSVVTARRYGYRLAWPDPSAVLIYSGEAWLDIPNTLGFSLHGARPNPSRGALSVAFQLAAGDEIQLELIDIAGRVVFEQRTASLVAGDHLLKLNGTANVAPGMYVLRLRQGVKSASTRVIMTR